MFIPWLLMNLCILTPSILRVRFKNIVGGGGGGEKTKVFMSTFQELNKFSKSDGAIKSVVIILCKLLCVTLKWKYTAKETKQVTFIVIQNKYFDIGHSKCVQCTETKNMLPCVLFPMKPNVHSCCHPACLRFHLPKVTVPARLLC
jgi:hypothetical protein